MRGTPSWNSSRATASAVAARCGCTRPAASCARTDAGTTSTATCASDGGGARRRARVSGLGRGGDGLVVHFGPAAVRVEAGHGLGGLGALRAQVLLEYLAVLAHHEAHHAAVAVLRRPGDHGEAAAHVVAQLV